MARQRLDVNQAADILGISTDAVRKRARRGTLGSEKAEDGSLYVWLDTGTPNGTPNGSTPTQAHLDSLQEQIEFLRRELERKDHLLAAALERIPAIEAPRTEPEGSEPRPATEGAQEAPEPPRSWWRRGGSEAEKPSRPLRVRMGYEGRLFFLFPRVHAAGPPSLVTLSQRRLIAPARC